MRSEWQHFYELSSSRRVLSVSALVVFLAALAVSIVLAMGEVGLALRAAAAYLTIVAAVLSAIAAFLRHGRALKTLLHPMIAPVGYLVYSLIVPLAYMAVTGSGIQVMPASIYTGPAVAVMCLAVLAYCFGVFVASVGLFSSRRSLRTRSDESESLPMVAPGRYGAITRDTGRLLLGLALAAKVQQLIADGPVFARVYGADQLQYDAGTTIAVAGATFTTVGCLLVMYANVQKTERPLLRVDWALLGAIGFISLFLLGTRSEIIAPVVLFLWFWLRTGKRFSVWLPLGAIGAAAAVFALVAQLRVKSPDADKYPAIESLLVDTSSPILLTSNVAALVPSSVDFYLGSTYLEAIKFMLPGPIARSLFGDPTGTGAFAYRELIDFNFSGQGWGFSLPTEAYLNFGFAGVFIIAAFVGGLFGRSFIWANDPRNTNRIAAYVYPLLLSYLPFGLRSDALGQMKSIIYPLIIVWVVVAAERFILARTGEIRNDRPWRWSDLRQRRGEF